MIEHCIVHTVASNRLNATTKWGVRREGVPCSSKRNVLQMSGTLASGTWIRFDLLTQTSSILGILNVRHLVHTAPTSQSHRFSQTTSFHFLSFCPHLLLEKLASIYRFKFGSLTCGAKQCPWTNYYNFPSLFRLTFPSNLHPVVTLPSPPLCQCAPG